MATTDDLLTAQKNGVVAVNTLNQTWLLYNRREHADNKSKCLTASTLITTGKGYIVTIAVIEAGTAGGFIYDFASTEQPTPDARVMAIPKETGVYRVDCPFSQGILVVPGAGQAVTVTYTLD